MKALFVFEYRETSPVTNIARNIADVMSKEIDIDAGIVFVGEDIRFKDDCISNIIKFGIVDEELSIFRNNTKWVNRRRIGKFALMCLHPFMLCKTILNRIRRVDECKVISNQITNYCTKNSVDVVIGFSNPYNIARALSICKADKKVLVQLDPYSTNPYVENFEKALIEENKIIEGIDYIFTTDLIINDLKKNGIKCKDKMFPIEFPVIVRDTFNDKLHQQKKFLKKIDGNIYFFHAGLFYKKIRNARVLAEVFRKLPENYILVLAGDNTFEIKKYSKDFLNRVIDLGRLSQEECEIIKKETDFLICFNNTVSNMIPSKLFDCIWSGKPFINISQIPNCPTKRYVHDYKNALQINIYDDYDINYISNFVKTHKGCIVEKKHIAEQYRTSSVDYVANQIKKVITENNKND